MTKIFMALTITNKPQYTESIRKFRIRVKNNFLLILNIGSIFGSILTATVSLFISDLREITDWNIFFIFGFLFSLPIFIASIMFHKIKLPCINSVSIKPSIKGRTKINKRTNTMKVLQGFIPILLLYITFFFNDPSLISMIYLSWFSVRFGDVFIRIVFILLPVYYVIMMMGNLFVARFLNNIKSSKKMSPESQFFIIGILTQSLVVLLAILLPNPIMVYILYFMILPFINPFETLTKSSVAQKIAQEGKNPTLRMQFISTANSLASMICSPIGLILSTIISIEYIYFIFLVFYVFTIVPFLFSSRCVVRNKRVEEIVPSLVILEEIEEIEKVKS